MCFIYQKTINNCDKNLFLLIKKINIFIVNYIFVVFVFLLNKILCDLILT